MGFLGVIWEYGRRYLEMRVSDIFGPHLTRSAVAFCVDIAICHRRKFCQVWGSPAPLAEVAVKLR